MPWGGAWRQGREGPSEIHQLLGFAEPLCLGVTAGGFPLSGNLPPQLPPCDVTAPAICPTTSTSLLPTGQAATSSGLLGPRWPALAVEGLSAPPRPWAASTGRGH